MLRDGVPLESALTGATRMLARPDDRAFARAIASEALRRLPDLDGLIDGATARRLPEDAKARFALRIALVQALAMGTPPHAAIATVLPLLEGGPRRLVHGVFGALLRSGATLPEVPRLPDDVARRWRSSWGAEAVHWAERLIAAPPPLDLSGCPPPAPEGVSLAPGHLRLPRGSAVADLAGYGEGRWWVQDLAASLPARLLGPGGGRTALDLCAAPGGKTMQLAAAGFAVTAVDLSESRLARLSENLERTGLSADLVAADLLAWRPPEPVEAILLDAPCSATGIYRRHPDVLHRVGPRAIADRAGLQLRLLLGAADWLVPGGRLVYSVCSLEPEEGERVIEAFLARRPDYALAPIGADELPAGASRPDGWLRLLPGAWGGAGGADSFFIARLSRKSGG